MSWFNIRDNPMIGAAGMVASAAWDAAFLLGAPIGLTVSDRTPYLVWGAAFFVLSTFQAFFVLLAQNRDMRRRLDTRPRLTLREPGAVHSDIVTLFDKNGQLIAAPTFIHVRFVNDPSYPEESAVAKDVAAKITFSKGGQIIRKIDGRWATSDQPAALIADALSTAHLLRRTFDIQDEDNVDIALKMTQDAECYMFNNDNYRHPLFKNPDYALGPGTYDVRIRLVGVHVDETFEFTFTNPGVGLTLRIGN